MSSDGGVSDFGISPPSGTEPTGPRPTTRQVVSARDDLSEALRRLIRVTVTAPLDDDAVRDATDALDALADTLEACSDTGRLPRSYPDRSGHPQDYFPTSPVIGYANPIAPPVQVEAFDDGLRGTVTFDVQYEGPPGCVHGGVIAMVFDEMLGAANIVVGSPGMTGTLTVRYRKPVPLQTEIRLEARFERRDGRKIQTVGTMHHGDVLLAEAEGLFIELRPSRFLTILAEQHGMAGTGDAGMAGRGGAAG